MNFSLLQVIGGIVALALGIMAWVKTARDTKAKQKAYEDAQIDAANNADALLRELDKLRDK